MKIKILLWSFFILFEKIEGIRKKKIQHFFRRKKAWGQFNRMKTKKHDKHKRKHKETVANSIEIRRTDKSSRGFECQIKKTLWWWTLETKTRIEIKSDPLDFDILYFLRILSEFYSVLCTCFIHFCWRGKGANSRTNEFRSKFKLMACAKLLPVFVKFVFQALYLYQ